MLIPARTSFHPHAMWVFWRLRMIPAGIMMAVVVIGVRDHVDDDVQVLLAVGPALMALCGTVWCTVAAGTFAVGMCEVVAAGDHSLGATHSVLVFATVTCVTAASVASRAQRAHRERELTDVRIVAEVAQRVLLRPVPMVVGPLRAAVRYISAETHARIGGDLYDVAATPNGVRVIVGDVQGKGLPAVETAAVVLGAFREAAYDERELAGVVERLETALARHLAELGAEEEFVTAVLIEIVAGKDTVDLLNCGHPAPLLLGSGPPRFVAGDEGPPLGLTALVRVPRGAVTLPFPPGHRMLLYTDGIAEARDRDGHFYPLDERGAHLAHADLADALDRLHTDVTRHVGGRLADDAAMLLLHRTAH